MIVVLTTVGRDFPAEAFSEEIVEKRLAACVSVVYGIRSVYRWENQLQHDDETLLVIKTTGERLEALREHVFASHPYDVPEFVVIQAAAEGAYLDWLVGNTSADLPR